MSKIMVINAGSSSLKFRLFEMPDEKVITGGNAERIGLKDGILTIKVGAETIRREMALPNHKVAADALLHALLEHHILEDIHEIEGVGHRVVQGGSYFSHSVKVDDDVLMKVEELCELAPLHNPAHLTCYHAFADVLPNVNHVFVFDTAFHQTMTAESYLFPVPYEWYQHHKIRRYGAHGTSHQFVGKRTAELMEKDFHELNIITCHLGNGASITAIKKGEVVNTSMGLTPLGGIMMGSRCGDIDPTVVFYMMKKLGCTPDEMDNYLNKKSGMLGVSGVSSDARDVCAAAERGEERSEMTLRLYVNRIVNTIGGYMLQMGHVDAISFTAGLGENQTNIREMILKAIEEGLHLSVDYELNKVTRCEEKISKNDSEVSIFVIPTNEELMIVRDTFALIGTSHV